jgi:Zn-dependent oligopeptidase
MAATQMFRQMSLASLDMAWHTHANPAEIKDVAKFEKAATEKATLLEHNEKACTSTAFGHIFAGGYSAGYYSYMWAEGLDADAFEPFVEKGLYDKTQGALLRDTIYAKGGSVDPMKLYKEYRGREPDPDALLRKRGILAPKKP